jgi:hypothetical protein
MVKPSPPVGGWRTARQRLRFRPGPPGYVRITTEPDHGRLRRAIVAYVPIIVAFGVLAAIILFGGH